MLSKLKLVGSCLGPAPPTPAYLETFYFLLAVNFKQTLTCGPCLRPAPPTLAYLEIFFFFGCEF